MTAKKQMSIENRQHTIPQLAGFLAGLVQIVAAVVFVQGVECRGDGMSGLVRNRVRQPFDGVVQSVPAAHEVAGRVGGAFLQAGDGVVDQVDQRLGRGSQLIPVSVGTELGAQQGMPSAPAPLADEKGGEHTESVGEQMPHNGSGYGIAFHLFLLLSCAVVAAAMHVAIVSIRGRMKRSVLEDIQNEEREAINLLLSRLGVQPSETWEYAPRFLRGRKVIVPGYETFWTAEMKGRGFSSLCGMIPEYALASGPTEAAAFANLFRKLAAECQQIVDEVAAFEAAEANGKQHEAVGAKKNA
jgi:hypothetical protein